MSEAKTQECLVWFWLVFLVVLVRLPTLEVPFDNDSAANAYHAQLIREGAPLYGLHHPGHHLPGIYYTYDLAYLLFGDTEWAVKFMLIPWILATTFCVYGFGKRLADRKTGALAATFFALLTSHMWLKGATAEAELFANLPRVAGVWLCVELIERRAKSVFFLFVGALGTIAFLYKAIYIAALFVPILLLSADAWRSRRWAEGLHRTSWMGIGSASVILPVAGYFFSIGLLDRLSLVFTMGSGYLQVLGIVGSIIAALVAPLIVLSINNLPILIIALVSLGFMIRRYVVAELRGQNVSPSHPTASASHGKGYYISGLAVVLMFLTSYVQAGIGRPGFVHYNLLLIPSLSILAAWGLVQLRSSHLLSVRHLDIWAFGALVLAVLGASLFANRTFYYHYVRYRIGSETYDSFLQNGSGQGRSYLSARKLATYLRPRCADDDYIYFWSDNMVLFDLIRQRVPVENPWPFYSDRFGSPDRIFNPRTRYIILGETFLRKRPKWLYEGIRKNYSLETVIDGQEIYRRNE